MNNKPDITIRLSRKDEIRSFGLGEFPRNGVEGKLIRLNIKKDAIDFTGRKRLTKKEWKNVITHELGHNVGINHSDFPKIGTQILGTPRIDRNSIMTSSFNRPLVVLNSKGLSKFDKIATKKMYNNKNTALCSKIL